MGRLPLLLCFNHPLAEHDDTAEQPWIVGKLITRFLAQRFRYEDIVALSCRGIESTAFKVVERVGNFTLAPFTGEYDLLGNQVRTAGPILFDVVRRLKGQQAAAVVLVDID